jgi:phosphate transport system protein
MPANSEHTVTRFDNELNDIKQCILRLGEMVRSQVRIAIEGLQDGRVSMSEVFGLGYAADELETGIEYKCNVILARRQPEARDLRWIMTALKITSEIEQIGDKAERVAKRAETLAQQTTLCRPNPRDVVDYAGCVLDMVESALAAFASEDALAALELAKRSECFEGSEAVSGKLMSYAMARPRAISAMLDYVFMVKAIERMTDHARNIAEHVIFMVKGSDVRHATLPEMEKIVLSEEA